MLPLKDDIPSRSTPFVTITLIAINVVVFLYQALLQWSGDIQMARVAEAFVLEFGAVPCRLSGSCAAPDSFPHPFVTILTSMFLHGGLLHVGGNMLYLWIFGDNIEHSLGHFRYLVFYILCGVAAALAQSLSAPTSDVPMVGASGAISGVLGAYLVLHPKANIRVFVFMIFITTINLPAYIVLGGWFVMQLLSSAQVNAGEAGVAFLAHIGGFIAGAVMVFFFRRREVPVFQPAHSRAFAVQRRPYRRGSVPETGRTRRGPWD
jgi:membrane associated rhomboid family serine protease